jgi:hypothetical protein
MDTIAFGIQIPKNAFDMICMKLPQASGVK